jgi:hypothetical protein
VIFAAWWLPRHHLRNGAGMAPVVWAAVRVYIAVANDARQVYRQRKAIQEPMTVELGGEAILPWRTILRWHQNDQLPKLFYLVPKSCSHGYRGRVCPPLPLASWVSPSGLCRASARLCDNAPS